MRAWARLFPQVSRLVCREGAPLRKTRGAPWFDGADESCSLPIETMLLQLVALEMVTDSESTVADVASKGPLARVCVRMPHQVLGPRVGLAAPIFGTNEGPRISVSELVTLQFDPRPKRPIAAGVPAAELPAGRRTDFLLLFSQSRLTLIIPKVCELVSNVQGFALGRVELVLRLDPRRHPG
jgi:hypothetical protein